MMARRCSPGVLVLPITLVVGYYVAVLTTRFGLDPDNQGVPFITATPGPHGRSRRPVRHVNIRGHLMNEQPRNVKDLLVELKDASELMVDLAYAAVFFNEDKLAQEVARLESADDRPSPPPADHGDARRPEPRGRGGHGRGAVDRRRDRAGGRRRVRHRAGGGRAARHPRRAQTGPPARGRDDRAGQGPRGRRRSSAAPPRALAAHRVGDVDRRDPQRHRLAVRPRPRRRGLRRRRARWSAVRRKG